MNIFIIYKSDMNVYLIICRKAVTVSTQDLSHVSLMIYYGIMISDN